MTVYKDVNMYEICTMNWPSWLCSTVKTVAYLGMMNNINVIVVKM